MADENIRYELRDRVAIFHIDDGKANALSPALIAELHARLDRAEKEAGAVLWVGRAGRFSAGFDLGVMRAGAAAAQQLVRSGADLFLRVHEYPLPVVAACTGHALAAGAILLLVADARLGAAGEYKIGLNEVAIGLTLPIFACELARQRLSKRHFARATSQAELYAPEGALDAGYLDRVVEADALLDSALAEAARLAQLPQPAFRNTKARINATTLSYIRETLDEDMAGITSPSS